MAIIYSHDRLLAEVWGIEHPILRAVAQRWGQQSVMDAILLLPKKGENNICIHDDKVYPGYRWERITLDDLRNLSDHDKSVIRDCYDTLYGTRFDKTEPQIAEFFHTL